MNPSKEKILSEAPEIPTETCPYINFIQVVLDEIKDEVDSHFLESKISLIHDHLEYIRESNEALRDSSKYWKRQFTNKKR